MGKRELLLICGFAVVGALVYYATAPEAAPGQSGFSIGRLMEEVKREIRGNQRSASFRRLDYDRHPIETRRHRATLRNRQRGRHD